jgi:type II secretory pathway pseudopilin PulG
MERHFNHSKKSARGFSFMEVVVVVSLLALVGGALSSMIQYFYRTNAYVLQEGTAVQNARQGLTAAMQNLRETSYGDDGSYPIASAATSTITFFANVNGGTTVQKVRYYVSGTTLYRGVTTSAGNPPTYTGQPESSTTIATYVRNASSTPIFQYYDSSGNLLSSPVNLVSVAAITTTILIDVDPSRSPAVYTLIGSATLRNLRGP